MAKENTLFPAATWNIWNRSRIASEGKLAKNAVLKLKISDSNFLANIIKYAPKHYVHIGLLADWESGEPKVLEPERSESWGWYEIENLPQPVFETCKLAMESYRTGKNFCDSDINGSK
jgi:hypothetical protein